MGEKLLISKVRVKRFLQEKGVKVSKEFYGALDNLTRITLAEGAKRAKQNDRSTIMGWDI